MMPDSMLDRDDWFEVYETLDETEQIILQMISVHYGGLSSDEIYQYLRTMKIRNPNNKSLQLSQVGLWLRELEQWNMLQAHGDKYVCPVPCMEDLTLRAAESGRLSTIWSVLRYTSHPRPRISRSTFLMSLIRQWRVYVYEKKWDEAEQLLSSRLTSLSEEPLEKHPYMLLFRNMYDLDWFFSLPISFLEKGLGTVLGRSLREFEYGSDIYEWLDMYCNDTEIKASPVLLDLWTLQTFFRGEFARLEQRLETFTDSRIHAWLGCLAFVRGQYDVAKQRLEALWASNPYLLMGSLGGLFLCLLWLKQGDPVSLGHVERFLADKISASFPGNLTVLYPYLKGFLELRKGQYPDPAKILEAFLKKKPLSALEQWWCWLLVFWNAPEIADSYQASLQDLQRQSLHAGYVWASFECCEMLERISPSDTNQDAEQRSDALTHTERWQTATKCQSILPLFQPKPVWEHSLDALMSAAQTPEPATRELSNLRERLIWCVAPATSNFSLSIRIQKRTAKGTWSPGRYCSLQDLVEQSDEMDFLLDQDRKICEMLQAALMKRGAYYAYFATSEMGSARNKILPMLVGHPFVVWDEQHGISVEVVKAEPIVRIVQNNNTLHISIEPYFQANQHSLAIQEGPARIRVYQPTEVHLRLSEVLGKKGIQVPAEAQQRVLDVIGNIAPLVTIHSDIGGSTEVVEEMENDPRLYLDLIPWQQGLKVQVLVLPFGEKGLRFFPGEGATSVFSRIDDKAYHTERNLELEKSRWTELMTSCPLLAQHPHETGEWILEEMEACLELVLSLQALNDSFVIRWPQGKSLHIKKRLSFDQMKWNISGSQDWFEASGSIAVDENQVLELQTLLRLMEMSPGRFLKLQDGQFLALTEEFRKRLEDLRSFSQSSGKNRRFHASAAFAMEEFFKDAKHLRTNQHWKEHCERLHSISQKRFDTPVEFKATLRHYQEDGFQWLSRLAHWRFGACLSDEMGLGKTLQALALLVSRAPDGPALVVAPTSVCLNWIDEAGRFAPTLRMISFGTKDRQDVLDNLQPMDVVVCSYALLQYETEKLSKVPWYTVILDEAQAIKNALTKRSKAAMELMGDFKMITTGTPIENHLGEFWNLFNFLNPGLLGGWEHFQKTFANPIERNQDAETREQLKKLVQPFVLRRRKMDVLRELPPRTEIVLPVELSPKEMALYEALRQEALRRIQEMSALGLGQQHIQILAELTRLRQVCCHPQLVLPDSNIPSSKLQILQDTLAELLENKHKVLIFSQFVTHLQLIVGVLEKQNIPYQYLDGSTPMRERKKRIDAFQAGEGDVFLLSLKAGGFGVNLTAADYVIHMDPWWNPAVEDQASDRAHRIGQTKPVTVYRLITRHTIEEKIVELHHRKRDLAESLLDGSDMTGKMSTDELIALIRNTI